MAKSAQQMAQNWSSAMSSPQTATKYKQGIAGVTENPMAKAATPDAMNRYVQGVQDSVNSGKRANALNRVSMQTWQQNAQNIGSTQLTVGAQKAQTKVQQHFQSWAPVYQAAHDAANSLPKGGEANALARVAAAMRVMMQAKGKQ